MKDNRGVDELTPDLVNIDEKKDTNTPKSEPDELEKTEMCSCDVLPLHRPEFHDKVVKAIKENPEQHFIIEDGIPYLVEAEDLIRELNDGL